MRRVKGRKNKRDRGKYGRTLSLTTRQDHLDVMNRKEKRREEMGREEKGREEKRREVKRREEKKRKERRMGE